MIGLIMAGGSGKRFWPLSRKNFPKQFLKITSDLTMIEMTFNRMLDKIKEEDIYVVTTKDQVHLVKNSTPFIDDEHIIVEPFGMNTAPAIALAMSYLSNRYSKDEVVFICGSDYEIKNQGKFIESLDIGEHAAQLGNLVTFGVVPTSPATGYGYVEAGEKSPFGFRVNSFKEKPDAETAKQFISNGNYYWNSGMFIWSLEEIFAAYFKYLPDVFKLSNEITAVWKDTGYKTDIDNLYSKMPKIPVDVGIMEKASNRIVVPVDYGWSDVGSWKALYEISDKDNNDNASKNFYFDIDSTGNYINSKKLVALIGVKNLVVVDTKDVLLIADMDKSEDVKKIVEALEKTNSNSI